MAIYGYTIYGTDVYGYDFPPEYRIDPFVASNINYGSVLVTWNSPADASPTNPNNPPGNPTGEILAYRLVKNRFGFPVDQDDGEILIDSLNYPGSQFVDTEVVPGQYQYYGFFLLVDFISDTWIRSGWTSCLAINSYSSGLQIHNLIPTFYQSDSSTSEVILGAGAPGEFPIDELDFFCEVLGWGIDYLKTQYDTYLNVNNPWTISIKDLYNLGAELGLNINPDIHPYTLRKAIYYNAVINEQRGTTSGIAQELDVLTGWNADLQLAANFMLENDQSAFLDPSFPAWSADIAYNVNEYVNFGNYWYQCQATGNIGHAPTGTNSSNTWWNPIISVDNNVFLANHTTGGINTWELVYPSLGNGIPPMNTLYEELGVSNPLNTTSFQYNNLKGYNSSGSSTALWLRSVARSVSDLNASPIAPNFVPNKDQVVGDGIPIPFVNPSLIWNGTSWNPNIRYGTKQIVTYSSQPFMALEASTNSAPPYTSRATANTIWAPISLDQRFRICISAYVTGSIGAGTVLPFVEWYDAGGNFITRVTARNTGGIGNVSAPSGLYYDSFTSGANTPLNNRVSDDGQGTWVQETGSLEVSPFYEGCVYPATSNVRSYATINSGVSNCQLGITFVTAPVAGFTSGLVMRWQDDNNYLIASAGGIAIKQNGNFSSLGTYPQSASLGDRLIVQLNGSSITAFINGVQALSVTSSFNTSGTLHGIINDTVTISATVTVTNPGAQTSTQGMAI